MTNTELQTEADKLQGIEFRSYRVTDTSELIKFISKIIEDCAVENTKKSPTDPSGLVTIDDRLALSDENHYNILRYIIDNNLGIKK